LIEAMLNIVAQSQPESYDECRLIAQVYAPDAFLPFAGEPSETKAAEVKTVKVLYDIYGNVIGRVEQKADGRLAIYNENGQQLGFLIKPEQETVGVLASSLKFNQHYILKLAEGIQVKDIFGDTPVNINDKGDVTLRVTDMLHFIPLQSEDFFYETTLFAGVIILMPPPNADATSKAAAANSAGGSAAPFASIAGSVQGAASSASAGTQYVEEKERDENEEAGSGESTNPSSGGTNPLDPPNYTGTL